MTSMPSFAPAATATVVAALLAAAPAAAFAPPLELPGRVAAAGSAGGHLVGADDTARSRAVLAAGRARSLGGGAWRVPAAGARTTVLALRAAGALRWSERNRPLRRAAAFETGGDGWGRSGIGVPAGVVPNVAPVAVIDDPVDPATPDLAGRVQSLGAPFAAGSGAHGTQVASVVASAADGRGIIGVLPGAPVLSIGVSELSCASVTEALHRAIDAKAAVVNLSLGGPHCFTLYAAVQEAVARGMVIVAASGNDYAAGNPVTYPAAYPHVLSVGALDRADRSSGFSTANLGVDLAAPGEGVPVATPPALDATDGTPDGLETVDGTSFAAPMVAAAAAWVRSVRPRLSSDQVGDVLMASARDVAKAGYDADTGYGALNIEAALRIAPLPKDWLEPNDDISSVDGTVFGRADPFVWRGGAPRTVRATGDYANDPYDVYRIRVPARRGAAIAVTARRTDPDLYVLTSRARSVADRDELIARSRRPAGRRDSVRIVNTARRAQTAYVVVDFAGERSLDAEYRLGFRRARAR